MSDLYMKTLRFLMNRVHFQIFNIFLLFLCLLRYLQFFNFDCALQTWLFAMITIHDLKNTNFMIEIKFHDFFDDIYFFDDIVKVFVHRAKHAMSIIMMKFVI